jgi:hypothetical protein
MSTFFRGSKNDHVRHLVIPGGFNVVFNFRFVGFLEFQGRIGVHNFTKVSNQFF